MPSPRSSPAMRPSSPLSPGYGKTSPGNTTLGGMHFDSLQLPSPRPVHSRAGNGQRRANNASLKLPSLPRFHPANFPSAHSSLQATPDGVASPHGPMSPRAHQRMLSDAQKHLYAYQRDVISAARASSPVRGKLAPLGSPGPVTPLELEGEEGYLVAGARSSGRDVSVASEELVERLILEEARRTQARSQSPLRTTGR
ncbi:hypothetical protein LTR36_001614 [Oleoguttula mirabilis]|uniref:Uncharacterized protein n=1 Tax=Oleoguttula mirabilis TaxID=1507867 RepID=A0AAV9JMV7_9PEZI|nr:hypothetical protein LTR36_001614 [Oleoguttula mirabilis]